MIGDPDPREPAVPPTAGLVRDFVNTVEWQEDAETWSTPTDLAVWLTRRTGVLVDAAGDTDLDAARRLREGLRSVLLAHAGHEPLPGSIEDLNKVLAGLPMSMHFDSAGDAVLVGDVERPVAEALARVLAAVDTLRTEGSWTRLKACARDSCRWAYWDTSRNSAGRWCSMAGCGNFVKMARRDGRDAPLVSEPDRPRAATIVDVAALAGVSIKTVSNVVTGAFAVSAPTRARVEAAIEQLDYRPNLAARALATGARTRG